MARLQLWELEDQAWFPSVLRDAGTAYLRWAAELAGLHRWIAPKLAQLLRASGTTQLVDLCSGGGGPVASVVACLRREGVEVRAVLTDLHPSTGVLERVATQSSGALTLHPEPVDATAVPPSLLGCRTLFNAFHHFRPPDARRILQAAVTAGEPIAVFEVAERSPAFLLGLLLSPLLVLLAVPFLRPFDWRWLLFTYALPLIPLLVLWDGAVSALRVYTVRELDRMVESIDEDLYVWESGRIRVGRGPAGITYVLGHPAATAA